MQLGLKLFQLKRIGQMRFNGPTRRRRWMKVALESTAISDTIADLMGLLMERSRKWVRLARQRRILAEENVPSEAVFPTDVNTMAGNQRRQVSPCVQPTALNRTREVISLFDYVVLLEH